MNIRNRFPIVALTLGLGLLGGCAAPQYSCPAPEHGVCKSVSDVYAMKSSPRSTGGHEYEVKSAPRHDETSRDERSDGTTPARGFSTFPLAVKPGDPLRREARVIRLWIAPWVDAKGDYYDQSYLYTEIDRGEWLIQERLRALQSETRVSPSPKEVKRD